MTFPMNHNQLLSRFRYFKDTCLFHNMLYYYSKNMCHQVHVLEEENHQVLYIQPNHEEDVVTAVENLKKRCQIKIPGLSFLTIVC